MAVERTYEKIADDKFRMHEENNIEATIPEMESFRTKMLMDLKVNKEAVITLEKELKKINVALGKKEDDFNLEVKKNVEGN